MSAPNFIRVCVIGQSNVGKSSIISTLFGGTAEDKKPVISPIPGTQLKWGSYDDKRSAEVLLRVHDSPGFQDSVFMLRELQHEFQFDIDLEKIAACSRLGHHPDDITAWHLVSESDVILFVIKVNEDPDHAETAKCALKLLQNSGKPAIAVFNFLGAEQGDYKENWIALLKRYSIFWICDYDAMHRDFMREKELLERIRSIGRPTLNDHQLRNLDAVISLRIERENRRIRFYREALAGLIFGVAAFKLQKTGIVKEALETEKEALHQALKESIVAASHKAKQSVLQMSGSDSWGIKPEAFDFDRMIAEDRRRIWENPVEERQPLSWKDYAKAGGLLTAAGIADMFGGLGIGISAAVVFLAVFYGREIVRESYNYWNKTYTLSAGANQNVFKELINIHREFFAAIRTRGDAVGSRQTSVPNTSRTLPEVVRDAVLRTIVSHRRVSDGSLMEIMERCRTNASEKRGSEKIAESLKQGYPDVFAEYPG